MKGTKAVLPPNVEQDSQRTAEVPAARERTLGELARHSAERADRLLALMTALGAPTSPREVAELIAREVPDAIGVAAGVVVAISSDGQAFERLAMFGFAPETMEQFLRLPIDVNLPITTAIRSGRIEVFDDVDQLVR